MKFFQTKFIVPLAIVVLLLLVLIGYFLFMHKTNEYFIISDHHTNLREGSPVHIENELAGKIEEVVSFSDTQARQIIKFSLSTDYSIPANSSFQLVNEKNGDQGFINIHVLASKYYYQPGDTIYLLNVVSDNDTAEPGVEKDRDGVQDKVVYKIQLAASKSKIPMDSSGFKGIDDIYELFVDGIYKYYTGNVESLTEAKKLRESIVEKGITDAFVVPFMNGERISIGQAVNYEK